MKTGYLKGLTELEIVIMAQNGSNDAMEFLWQKYRKPMMNVFFSLPMTPAERESEAADVFMHYVKHLFDPDKEENQGENWTFFSYLYSGMIGRRAKLRRERIFLSYDESETDLEEKPGAINAETVCLFNRGLYSQYDPESAAIEELCVNTKTRRFRGDIARLQKVKAEYSARMLSMLHGLVE
jgi:hypothetical protein